MSIYKTYFDFALEELQKEIAQYLSDRNSINVDTLNYRAISCVHILLDLEERLKTDGITLSEELKKYLLAFRFINNKVKHKGDLIQIQSTSYAPTLGFELGGFAIMGKSGVVWADFSSYYDVGRKSDQDQFLHYEKLLKHQDIRNTLKSVKRMLDSQLSEE